MKIAAVQAAPVFLDAQATTDKALDLLGEAADQGAQLIVFPEVFISGYPIWLRTPSIGTSDELLQIGHTLYIQSSINADGPELAAIHQEARRRGVFVYIGFVERSESRGSVYASLAAIHPDKGIVGIHRKIKPTFHERLIWSDGDGAGLRTHDWHDFRLGGLNCYENWLPLARHALYAQGEQIHIATWPGDLDVTQNISQFIAMEGRIYVVSVSGILRSGDIPDSFPLKKQVVEGRKIINNGGSMIVAPQGEIIAGPEIDKECILYAEADIKTVIDARLKLDPAGHYSRDDILSLNVNRMRKYSSTNDE